MADATTPNYSLTLIQIGLHRDTWGDLVNANMTAIDTALKAVSNRVGAVGTYLPVAGGAVTGAITRAGAGVLPYFADAAMTGGRIYLTAASGADPTSQPGDLWLGY